MSNVTLNISGYSYTIACAPGEEEHVRELGGMIDEKLREMPGAAGQNESRMLLFASLLLADELHEIRQRGAASPNADGSGELAEQLEQLADRYENLANLLER